MAEKVIIETEVKVDQPVAQFKNLKTQIREARLEQQRAAEQFGENSQQATAFAKKLSDLKERQEDLNRSTQAYASDPFDRAEFAIRGVAAGFQAAAGAAAIFGGESEDVQKALLKVQGAMALTQGIKDIVDLGKAYGLFSKDTLVSVVKSLGTVRGALIATGVGAATVAVGYLVANWDRLVSVFRDFIGLSPSVGEILDRQTRSLDDRAKKFERMGNLEQAYIESLTGRLKEEEALDKQFRDKERENESAQKKELLELEKQYRVEESITTDRYLKQKKDITDYYARIEIANAEAKQTALAEQQKKFQKEDADAAEKKRKEDEAKREKEKAEFIQYRDNLAELNRKYEESQDKINEEKKVTEDEALEEASKFADSLDQNYQRVTTSALANNAKQKLSDKELAEFRVKVVEQSANLAGAFADLIGRQTAAGKTAALLQVGFDTAKALTGALAISQSPTPDNVATGGLAGVAKYIGIAATILSAGAKAKQIINSGNPGGGGSSAPSLPSVNFQAPQIPRGTNVEGAGDIQLSQRQQPSRVYVVESDIRRTVGKVNVIDQNTTIG